MQIIRESAEPLRRNGADPQYLSKNPITELQMHDKHLAITFD